jgi:hypothetical protein
MLPLLFPSDLDDKEPPLADLSNERPRFCWRRDNTAPFWPVLVPPEVVLASGGAHFNGAHLG